MISLKLQSICAASLIGASFPSPPVAFPTKSAPPMGWMNWEIFECQTDCDAHPDSCVNDDLFKVHADRLVGDGYLAAGYDTVHVDDCWMSKKRTEGGELVGDPDRFPDGMEALGDYLHQRGIKFGMYTAESPNTCQGYPASAYFEQTDAQTFAGWGVDYLKVDGCGNHSYFSEGYKIMGDALRSTGRNITYSCSWPAYLGENETAKDGCYHAAAFEIGCNLWRNWHDIGCSWSSLSSIIEHWGKYGGYLAQFAGPGRFNDPDMLLVGNVCITEAEARTQMAIWSIAMAPLIMGNDLRIVPREHRDILLNEEAIAVDQDPLLVQGTKVSGGNKTAQVWVRILRDGHAVGLYNPTNESLSVTVEFRESGLPEDVHVRNIWSREDVGQFHERLTSAVDAHDTLFLKLTPVSYATG